MGQTPTLQDQAYALLEGPAEVVKKNLTADSHELAHKTPEVRGAIQTNSPTSGNAELVRDIGWHKANVEIPDPLIGGYTNGELFSIIRRFNKDVFDVKAVPAEIASGLDLNDAWAQDRITDKVTLNLQRVYLSVVLGIASFAKHVSRLRSWKETRRTTAFCTKIYFIAWIFDMLVPLAIGTLIATVSSRRARTTLFPPAPRALVNMRTGGIQKPQAGQLGTNETLTGAPEKQPGEAVEEEAANFVANVRHNIQRALGMHDSPQGEGEPLEGKVPKPIRSALKTVHEAGSAPGHVTENMDQTQRPMEEIIWSGVNPEIIAKVLETLPHVIGEIADNWERFANAISPKPPFSRFSFLRIDAVLAPILLVSLFVDYYMVYKGTGFAIGFVIFGDPILRPAIAWFKRHVPNYKELVQPKNNFLRGVPTNTQKAITLLRIGEAYNTPLPPVPTSNPSDTDHQNIINAEDIPLGATHTDILDAATPGAHANSDGDEEDTDKPKHKHLSRVVRFFKGNARSVVETKLAIDHVRAAAGSETAKGHLGVMVKTEHLIYTGPSQYSCRFQGKHGWLVIRKSAGPSLLFTHDDPRQRSVKDIEPVFEISVKDMKRVKRAMAFVSSTVESVAAASSDKQLLASLEIDDEKGKTWRFTAIPERDALFNRLVSIGDQKWKNM
ncbi:uncharacterized protein N7515_004052 [Penicillium bovifimosum]|uniref:Proteasome subunit beta type protein n=1 Tax=Penicillium bovifimosum TaxID=126998 RepID=A0A9W9H7J4_9EURO|nr:uncharacterized protein N7515_004052 [Penicillium bovifimosum]KAJ5139204.1 hypothetical protein N7515_004052 [Penicillium bovifimosum]